MDKNVTDTKVSVNSNILRLKELSNEIARFEAVRISNYRDVVSEIKKIIDDVHASGFESNICKKISKILSKVTE